jgi:IS5 family transposase
MPVSSLIESRPMKHRQPGLFDVEARAAQLTNMGDSLVGLKARTDWKAFRPELARAHEKDRKNQAGAKPFDVVLMFKIFCAPTSAQFIR